MALVRYDPFKDLRRFQDEVSNWFNGDLAFRSPGESFGWSPAVDIYEDSEGVTLKFDLPEVDPKDVDVRLEDGTLTIRGERKFAKEDKKENYHRIERSYGAFARSFSLPATLDFEKVKADSKNGVLNVFLPKRAEAKPKSIQVKVN
ncbi:MAG TPA: Hsp20/alpha crystallin family protein [Myxococcaceae bacterium]|nr:Hsp20/alpha crystallin family protein [Myxococcaceae bacterium]